MAGELGPKEFESERVKITYNELDSIMKKIFIKKAREINDFDLNDKIIKALAWKLLKEATQITSNLEKGNDDICVEIDKEIVDLESKILEKKLMFEMLQEISVLYKEKIGQEIKSNN